MATGLDVNDPMHWTAQCAEAASESRNPRASAKKDVLESYQRIPETGEYANLGDALGSPDVMGVCDELGKLKAKGESSVSSSVVFWMVQLIELLFQVARSGSYWTAKS